MVQIALNLDQMISNIHNDIKKASCEVLFSFACNILPFEAFKILSKDIKIKRLDSLENAVLYGYKNLEQSLKNDSYGETRFIACQKDLQQFSVVDGKRISFLNPDKSASCVGQTINNSYLGAKYKMVFVDLYNNAIPMENVVQEMKRQKDILLESAEQSLANKHFCFLQNIIDYGVNSSLLAEERNELIRNHDLRTFVTLLKNHVVANITLNASNLLGIQNDAD